MRKTFAEFVALAKKRFGENVRCSESEGGVFIAKLDKAESRMGAKGTVFALNEYRSETVPENGAGKRAEGDANENEVTFSFSSEAPVLNWGDVEILSHHPDDADFSRMAEVGAILYNHDANRITGVPVKVWVEGTKSYCTERFGTTDTAELAKKEVLVDKTLRGISVGFVVQEWAFLNSSESVYRNIKGTEDGVWVATKWQALEASHTPIPADPTVGVNRNASEPDGKVGTEAEEEKTNHEIKPKERKIVMLTDAQKKRAQELGLDPETATVDQLMKAERAEGVKQEQERQKEIAKRHAEIRAMGELHDVEDLAKDAIKREISAGEFALELADKKRAGTLPNVAAARPSSDERDLNKFSITRFLAGVADQLRGGSSLNGIEAEMAQEGAIEARDAGLSTRGITLPYKIVRHLTPGKRTLTAGSATSAGNLIDTELKSGDFVDALRAEAVLGQMGATFLTGLVGNIKIPRQTNVLVGENVAETGTLTSQTMTTDTIDMSPKRIGVLCKFSQQLLKQVGNPSVEAWNRKEIFSAITNKIDYDALNGSGTGNTMLGLRSILTAISLGTNGAALDWGKVVALETAASNANALNGALKYLTNSKVRGSLRTTLKASSAGSTMLWEGAGLNSEVANYPAVASNLVLSNTTTGSSHNTSDMFFGNWNDLIIAMWGGIDFILDPYTGAADGEVRLIANVFADCDVRHEESFAMYSGVIA